MVNNSQFLRLNWSHPVISSVILGVYLFFKWLIGQRWFSTSSCARLGDISVDEGSWEMTPALVWRQWPLSIKAETWKLSAHTSRLGLYLVTNLLREAESIYPSALRALNRHFGHFPGESGALQKICLSFVLVQLLHHIWRGLIY